MEEENDSEIQLCTPPKRQSNLRLPSSFFFFFGKPIKIRKKTGLVSGASKHHRAVTNQSLILAKGKQNG